MRRRSLQIQQLSRKMQCYAQLKTLVPPPTGWIKAVRTALGMSMQQLGNRLSITRQSAQEIEQREQDGSITLKSLRDAAHAMDMELVYGFVPKDGSIDHLIERRAKALAKEIVLRTSHSMRLEDQENSKERIQQAIEERAMMIQQELPKALWD